MASEKKVWIVTGASSGLGKEIALAALRAGHYVIGTARNPEKAAKNHPEVEKLGGKWLKLDVVDPQTQEIIESAAKEAGRIDVLVNNAGSSAGGGLLEDIPIQDYLASLEANVIGPIKCIKGVLPTMRAQKSGTIVNHGSCLGLTSTLGGGAYCVSKFGLEAISESCSIELKEFNIRTIHLSTGYFQTELFKSGVEQGTFPSEPYLHGTAAAAFGKLAPSAEPENLPGDPKKLGARLVEILDGTGMGADKNNFHWVSFGKDAQWAMRRKAERLLKDADTFEEVANSTDVDGFDENSRVWPDKVKDILL